MALTPVIETKLQSGIYVPNAMAERADPMLGLDQWAQYFDFGGLAYPFWPRQTLLGQRQEWPDYTFEGYIQGIYKANGPIFTCMLVRMLLFSEARFQFRQLNDGRPGELFGNKDLAILERPWPNGTTGDLLTRAIQDADLAGNAFFTRQGGHLVRMRPDWITIVAGSPSERPTDATADPFNYALDTQVIGYMFQPGGPASSRDPIVLLPEEVCHFAPIPDPIYRFRGMSWITPVIREVLADNAATSHKLKFFENGATVNMVVSLDPKIQKESFDKWVETFEQKHRGTLNAYKTLYLGGGATVTPVGATPEQIDFQVTQGAGETRIANAAGVPPVIAGFAEGLRSATYCLPGGERVWTLEGPRPIAELKPGDALWAPAGGSLRPACITWQGCVGERDVYAIRTKNRLLRATANHPVLVRRPGRSDRANMDRSADIEWRQVGELRAGDQLVQAVGLPDQAIKPNWASPELIRWLGAYVGDGSGAGKGAVRLAIPPTDRVRDYYEALTAELFDARIGHEPRGFRMSSRGTSEMLAILGFAGTARTKRIPGWVFRLPRPLRLEFLAGLMDTDGSVQPRGVGTLGFANRELVEQVRMLFVSCGVQVSNVVYRNQLAAGLPNPGLQDGYDFWSFAITTRLGEVPVADPLYLQRLRVRRDVLEGRHERNRTLDPEALGMFTVRSIELLGPELVYDISVEGDHSFLAAGVAVHNSNYGQARRHMGDATLRPLWRNFAGSMETLVPPPHGSAELWYDDRDIAFLREDRKDVAQTLQLQAATISSLVNAGYEPDTVVQAVMADDLSLLEKHHTGLFSVQLQPPMPNGPTANDPNGPPNGSAPAVPANT